MNASKKIKIDVSSKEEEKPLASSNGSVEAFLLLDTYLSVFNKNKNKVEIFKEFLLIDSFLFLKQLLKPLSNFYISIFFGFVSLLLFIFNDYIAENPHLGTLLWVVAFCFFGVSLIVEFYVSGFKSFSKFNVNGVVKSEKSKNLKISRFLKFFNISKSKSNYSKEKQKRILELLYWGKLAFSDIDIGNRFNLLFNRYVALDVNDIDYKLEVNNILDSFVDLLDLVCNIGESYPYLADLLKELKAKYGYGVNTIEGSVNDLLQNNEQRLLKLISKKVNRS